jgi:hypothetical protein
MTQVGIGFARRKWVRWAAGIAAALVLLGVLVFVAVTSRPTWYRPVTVRPEEYATIRNELPNFGNDIGRHMEAGQPFTITIPDECLNRWLAARSEIWPGLGDALPKHIADPLISFQPGRAVLAVRYEESGLSSVLSLAVNLKIDPSRAAIHVRVDNLRAGYLPVPRLLVDGPARRALDRHAGKHLDALLRRLRAQAAEYMPVDNGAKGPGIKEVPLAAMLGDIWEFRLPTHTRWPNGGFPYHISDLRIEQGKMVIDVVPMPRQATRPSPTTRPNA